MKLKYFAKKQIINLTLLDDLEDPFITFKCYRKNAFVVK